jgi:ABC-type lipoprotein export system ATPase subunit
MSFVEFHDVKKTYHMGEVEIPALQGVNFEIEKGEFCVIVGASGAGKTTLLQIIGTLSRDGGKGPAGWKRNFLLRKEAADRLPQI